MMKAHKGAFLAFCVALMVLVLPVYAQTPASPCTSSMLTTFTPCINYITNSSRTGTSPTSDCCSSLRSLMNNGTGCLCQIVTGGVPFRIPINRTLAISLPRACNQPGVPVSCKAAGGAPLPAPGPTAALSPSASPAGAIAPGPSGSTIPTTETPSLAPVSDTTPSTTAGSFPPTSSTGAGSSLTPSASMRSFAVSPSLLLFSVAIMVMKYF